MLFQGNDVREVGEGALYFCSYAQLGLFTGSHLEFILNIGRYVHMSVQIIELILCKYDKKSEHCVIMHVKSCSIVNI